MQGGYENSKALQIAFIRITQIKKKWHHGESIQSARQLMMPSFSDRISLRYCIQNVRSLKSFATLKALYFV